MKLVKNAIIAVAILVVGILVSKKLGSMSQKEEIKEDTRKMELRVVTADTDTIAVPLKVYGKLTAQKRANLLAEVSGIFRGGDRAFLEGTSFNKGEVMIQLDDAEALANVMSLKGNFINALLGVLPDIKQDYPGDYERFESYYEGLSLEAALPALPEAMGKLEKFLIARGMSSAYYQVKSAEERLEKFAVKAPFDGVVASALVKPGNLVSPGRALGTFLSPSSYEMTTAVTLAYADQLSVGQKVLFSSPDIKGNWSGKITRIAPVVDDATQSVSIVVRVSGKDLREGMYLTGKVQGLEVRDALKVPAHMVSDNEFVYTIENDSILQRKAVNVVEWLDNEIIITGVPSGTMLVDEPTLKAASGLVVIPVK